MKISLVTIPGAEDVLLLTGDKETLALLVSLALEGNRLMWAESDEKQILAVALYSKLAPIYETLSGEEWEPNANK